MMQVVQKYSIGLVRGAFRCAVIILRAKCISTLEINSYKELILNKNICVFITYLFRKQMGISLCLIIFYHL
jgi:hypothetical protein